MSTIFKVLFIYQNLNMSDDPQQPLLEVICHAYASIYHSQSAHQLEMPGSSRSKNFIRGPKNLKLGILSWGG